MQINDIYKFTHKVDCDNIFGIDSFESRFS